MCAILITNTWTRSEYIFPEVFPSLENALKAMKKLQEISSATNGIKNNEYSIFECLPLKQKE